MNIDAEAMSRALDAIHDEADRLLGANPPESVRQSLELIRSIARYKHDVRSQSEIDGPGNEPPAGGEELSFKDAYDMLISWSRSLVNAVEGCRSEIEETLKGNCKLPENCPSHASLASMAYSDVRKKFVEVDGFVRIVDQKIRNGGK